MSTFKFPRRGAALILAVAGLAACETGPSTSSKQKLNAMIAAQNYAGPTGAEAYLEQNKEKQYGKKNLVLYYLDKGIILHHEGKYKESDQSLDLAEKRMEELYTISITKTGGMFLLNDGTVDYAGEPFERAMTNVVRALNYVFLGQPEEALVESRKVEVFLDELNRKLEKKSVYRDDAFARYLDALLYADAGKLDDARISMEAANQAYGWYASDYNTPAPKFELHTEKDKPHGELVFIHYNGISPRKISKTFQIAWGQAVAIARTDEGSSNQQFKNALTAGVFGSAITVAYPEYVQDPFTITASEVRVDSEGPVTASTVLMEDISAIATKALQDRNALIRTRAVARATIKWVTAEAAARAAKAACKQVCQSYACYLCELTGAVAHGAAAASEVADTRGWATLPSQIRMARIKVPPGKHTVTVVFKNAAGVEVPGTRKVFTDVEVVKSKRTYLGWRTAI